VGGSEAGTSLLAIVGDKDPDCEYADGGETIYVRLSELLKEGVIVGSD
jgi:hypothetical protein